MICVLAKVFLGSGTQPLYGITKSLLKTQIILFKKQRNY